MDAPFEPPPLVQRSLALGRELGFENSCTPEVGRLLQLLVTARNGGRIGETGTGCGVGAAWMASALAPSATLVTVEREPTLAPSVQRLFSDLPNVTVLHDDWLALHDYTPFDLLFVDGGGKRTEREEAIGMLAPGGMMVMDDFTPSYAWPPMFKGQTDEERVWWLTHPRLIATQLTVAPDMAVILACTRSAVIR